MAIHRFVRCSSLTAAVSLALASCSPKAPDLSYHLQVSPSVPRQMTITLRITGGSGAYLDLHGHSPKGAMLVEGFDVREGDGRRLQWEERAETTRVNGTPLQMSTYRIAGPIPSTLVVRYRVSPGRREGDPHIGFTGRCFGYLGPDFALITGRDVFLLPGNPHSVRSIEVAFSLPPGWIAETPWRAAPRGWVVAAPRGN